MYVFNGTEKSVNLIWLNFPNKTQCLKKDCFMHKMNYNFWLKVSNHLCKWLQIFPGAERNHFWTTVQCTYYPNLVFLIFNYLFGSAIPTCGVNPRHNFQKLLVMLKITSFLNFFPWMLHWKNFSKTLAFPPEGCVLSCVKIKVDTSRMSGAPTFVSIKSSLKSVIITNIFLHMYILCMLLQIKMPVICPKVCTRVSLLGHWGTLTPFGFGSLTYLPEKWKKFREIFDFVLISRIFSKL